MIRLFGKAKCKWKDWTMWTLVEIKAKYAKQLRFLVDKISLVIGHMANLATSFSLDLHMFMIPPKCVKLLLFHEIQRVAYPPLISLIPLLRASL